MITSAIPVFPHPCLYASDFNCQHVNWDNNTTSPDGESLVDWATKSNLALLHNPKDPPSFFSGRWNTCTNPDLAFASKGHVCWQLDRRILEKFSRSQQRPSLIKSSKTVVSLPSEPYKRWNFRRAKWKKYMRITNRLSRDLPSVGTTYVDEAYQDFCNTIIHAAKKSIPRGRRKNYRPR